MIRYGTTRITVLIGRYAIKVPNFSYSWQHAVLGMVSNRQEHTFSKLCRAFCPTVFCSWLGLVLVARRAIQPVEQPSEEDKLELLGSFAQMVENKDDSWGMLDGKLVAVDYGSAFTVVNFVVPKSAQGKC